MNLERLFCFIKNYNLMISAIAQPIIQKFSNVGKLIGNTPLYELENVYQKPGVRIFAKLEWHQLGASVKARAAFNIIKEAVLNNQLSDQKCLLDATSGNTGIAYAAIGAALGIPVRLCLPENASKERKQILRSLGADLVFTSPFEATDGAQREARTIVEAYPDQYYYADQYSNPNNWKAHYKTTSREIWEQTNGQITHFVAGLGTTGTFIGTTRGLKALNPAIQSVALHPDNPMHGLEGWKHLDSALVPQIYDDQVADRNLEVDTLEAYDMAKKIARKEGIQVSPSAGANLLGAIKLAETIEEGIIVTTFADDASKYTDALG